MKFQVVKFVRSVFHNRDLPDFRDLPEIAVVGRSNVGKSSLLNHLFRSKGLVKTSSQPGKTRSLNFYKVDEQVICVDMPGYGYAAAPKKEKELWSKLIESYLLTRSSLKMLLFLFDIRREPTPEDLQMMAWINHRNLPALLVLTKVDKINHSARNAQTKRITDRLKELPYVHYSVTQNEGRRELIALLRKMLGQDGLT